MVPTWLPQTTKGAPSPKTTTKLKARGAKRHPKWRPWAPELMNVRAGVFPFHFCIVLLRLGPSQCTKNTIKPVVFQGFPKLVCFLFPFILKSFRFVFKPLWVTLWQALASPGFLGHPLATKYCQPKSGFQGCQNPDFDGSTNLPTWSICSLHYKKRIPGHSKRTQTCSKRVQTVRC